MEAADGESETTELASEVLLLRINGSLSLLPEGSLPPAGYAESRGRTGPFGWAGPWLSGTT